VADEIAASLRFATTDVHKVIRPGAETREEALQVL
jgi:hypothetical protein